MSKLRVAIAGVSATALVCSGMLFNAPSAAAAVITKTCADTKDASSPLPGTWTAKYTTSATAYGTAVNVTFLGFKPKGSTTTTEYLSNDWTIAWFGVDASPNDPRFGSIVATSGSNAHIQTSPVMTYLFPRIITPSAVGARCTIFLVPYSVVASTGKPAALIGDSITLGTAPTLTERTALATRWNNNGWKFEHDGFGGMTYRQRRNTIRGIVATSPKALVIELGANDAIALAANFQNPAVDANGNPLSGLTQSQVSADIAGAVSEAKAATRCLILVTPPTYPAPSLDVFTADGFAPFRYTYQLFATWVADQIKAQAAASAADRVTLLDWDALSAPHHLADGTAGDWFNSTDEIHPNGDGNAAFIDAVAQATFGCTA